MEKKILFACMAALLTLAVALPVAAKSAYSFTFDDSLKPFTAMTNDAYKSYEFQLLDEPGPLLCFGCPPNRFAGLKLIPTDTQSGVWMVAEVGQIGGIELVHVSFDAKDAEGCATCLPMTYVGVQPPTAAEFAVIDTPGLAKSWQTFSHTIIVAGDVERPFYVAIGWRVKDDMLKAKGLVGFDNVEVAIAPAP